MDTGTSDQDSHFSCGFCSKSFLSLESKRLHETRRCKANYINRSVEEEISIVDQKIIEHQKSTDFETNQIDEIKIISYDDEKGPDKKKKPVLEQSDYIILEDDLQETNIQNTHVSPETENYCIICDRIFAGPSTLKIHKRAIHNNLNPKPDKSVQKSDIIGKDDIQVISVQNDIYQIDICEEDL